MLDFRVYELRYRSYGAYFNNESIGGRVVFSAFEDGPGWWDALKDTLEDPNKNALCGEYVCFEKIDDNVKIELTGWNYEDGIPPVVIKKESLLKNLDVWMSLAQKRTPEVAIIYYDKHKTIEVVDRRSKPELYMIDINMQSVERKEYDFVLLKQQFRSNYYIRVLDNDPYLSTFSQLFTYQKKWTDMVEQALRDPQSKGVSYEETNVIIDEQKVTIQPARYYKPEELAITFSRDELLNLIKQWSDLAAKNIKLIVIKRHEDQNIIIEECHGKAEKVQQAPLEPHAVKPPHSASKATTHNDNDASKKVEIDDVNPTGFKKIWASILGAVTALRCKLKNIFSLGDE